MARNCYFCGKAIEPGSGFIHVRKDGVTINFCSRKCKVNMIDLGRVSRKTRWTNEFHTIKNMKKESSKNQ
ncbi:50S ribosomal protein L24e [Oxyplasma meridianum]|uniref:50S ribosomal protein L24e n=1 Tax=Oxyplasma meridianum TaxID=3073602 RepID=A0AAX4NFJ9_9ARCH